MLDRLPPFVNKFQRYYLRGKSGRVIGFVFEIDDGFGGADQFTGMTSIAGLNSSRRMPSMAMRVPVVELGQVPQAPW